MHAMPAASEPAARRVGEYILGCRIGVGGMAVVDAAYQGGVGAANVRTRLAWPSPCGPTDSL